MSDADVRRPDLTVAGYYDASYPPDVLTPPPPATGATAGIPGSWTPPGSTPPASPAELAAGNPVPVTASPVTAWTTGQYVQTGTAGAAGRATWTGSAWVGGAAPLEADAEAELGGDASPDVTAEPASDTADAGPDDEAAP